MARWSPTFTWRELTHLLWAKSFPDRSTPGPGAGRPSAAQSTDPILLWHPSACGHMQEAQCLFPVLLHVHFPVLWGQLWTGVSLPALLDFVFELIWASQVHRKLTAKPKCTFPVSEGHLQLSPLKFHTHNRWYVMTWWWLPLTSSGRTCRKLVGGLYQHWPLPEGMVPEPAEILGLTWDLMNQNLRYFKQWNPHGLKS